MKIKRSYIILSLPAIILIAALIYLIIGTVENKETIVTGIIETTEIDVASKIPGRIDSVFFDKGNYVHKGDILATLESKELDAKVEQAKGMMEAARSKMEMVHNGARIEEKTQVEKYYNQAKEQYDYADKTWKRYQSLYKDGVISSQENDGMEFKYNSAKEQMEAAKAKYDMVMKGARFEEIDAVEALFHQAENGYNEVMAYHQELKLKAPVDGEVSNRITDPGEVIASGYPLFTIIVPGESYVLIQIREDKLSTFKKGSTFKGTIPALDNKEAQFEVTYIASMADFATWRPTNQKGDFDLKTFEIHLKSKKTIADLRPGMSVCLSIPNK
ncbi:MAG: efflux RND transporter periplasmic adaptor subunit [bacterium]